MKPSKRLIIRSAISILLGLCVAWMPLNMAGGSWVTQFSPEQMTTQRSLKRVASVVEDYKSKQGRYPSNLQRLLPAELDDTDGWKRPWVYSLVGGEPLIESLGRDGKRGGAQQDADLSNLTPRPANARLSAWQSALHPAALGLRVVALITGALMATLVFVGLKAQTFERVTLLPLALSLGVSLALAVFGAMFIAIAHVPSGH